MPRLPVAPTAMWCCGVARGSRFAASCKEGGSAQGRCQQSAADWVDVGQSAGSACFTWDQPLRPAGARLARCERRRHRRRLVVEARGGQARRRHAQVELWGGGWEGGRAGGRARGSGGLAGLSSSRTRHPSSPPIYPCSQPTHLVEGAHLARAHPRHAKVAARRLRARQQAAGARLQRVPRHARHVGAVAAGDAARLGGGGARHGSASRSRNLKAHASSAWPIWPPRAACRRASVTRRQGPLPSPASPRSTAWPAPHSGCTAGPPAGTCTRLQQ